MFKLIIKYLGFLKEVPLIALVFDSILKLITLISCPALANYIDDIEAEVLTWAGVVVALHKYGGIQFNYRDTEIGHIHGNGLLDLLLNLKIKQQLLTDGRATHHHTFIKSGWVSFYIRNADDKMYALRLLRLGYERHSQNSFPVIANHLPHSLLLKHDGTPTFHFK